MRVCGPSAQETRGTAWACLLRPSLRSPQAQWARSDMRSEPIRLVVMSRQGVQSGDGCGLPDRRVGPVVIVEVDPSG